MAKRKKEIWSQRDVKVGVNMVKLRFIGDKLHDGSFAIRMPPGCLTLSSESFRHLPSRAGTVSLLAPLTGSINLFILPAEIVLHLLRAAGAIEC